MNAEQTWELTLGPAPVPGGHIVTARSFFIDRIVPDCECIAVPEHQIEGGQLTFCLGPGTAKPAQRRRRPFARSVTETAPSEGWVVDLRHHDPLNWAHFLNNHLPLVFWMTETAGLDWGRGMLLMPAETPAYIQAAADLFGLKLWCTDAEVRAPRLAELQMAPWTAIRTTRTAWARLPQAQAALDAMAGPETALPKKVFLSRRNTRALTNEAEIEARLAERGFVTVYPEDLSASDQIHLFRGAEDIVAIHGAGLAPLLYCKPGAGPRLLVEILSCGHMTNVYRAMANEVGCRWIGVRGRIKPEYVTPAYRFDAPFRAYSLDNFEVDPASLDLAFQIVADAEGQSG